MGRMLVVARLVARDLRRRRGEAALMLVTIMTATATLTLGLILHGVTSRLLRCSSLRGCRLRPRELAGSESGLRESGSANPNRRIRA